MSHVQQQYNVTPESICQSTMVASNILEVDIGGKCSKPKCNRLQSNDITGVEPHMYLKNEHR
jgi:hypothetical protein